MTKEEIEKDLACLRKFFSIVRLIQDGDDIKENSGTNGASLPEGICHCDPGFEEVICQYCRKQIYGNEFPDQGIGLDFKIVNSQIYQVFTQNIVVDKKPYLLEMLKKLTDDELVQLENYKKLLSYSQKRYTDTLTGAYNHRFYEDEMKYLSGNAGVALIDIDDLRLCNERYGHEVGDAALCAVVGTVKGLIRSTDKLIRYGGDEFLLIMPDVSPAIFSNKLHLIQEQIAEATLPMQKNLHISVSIGGSMHYNGNLEETVSTAERLMYQARVHKHAIVLEDDATEQDITVESVIDKPYVLIVDDSEFNRDMLQEMLAHRYRILQAESGSEGLSLLNEYGTQISLVLLDIVMPDKDGFEVLQSMKQDGWLQDIPVIMISSESSAESIEKAYELGASDYVSRPFSTRVVRQRVANIIRLYARQQYLLHSMVNQRYEKERNNSIMIAILSEVVGFVNGESRAHVLHVSRLTEMIIEELLSFKLYHISEQDQYLISTAAALHDIGKIAVDPKILNKPGKLTKVEFDAMKAHTVVGAEMVKNLEQYQQEPLVQIAYQICRWHHERWDGHGYPDGLRGDEIPISAQIVSLADVYDALTSKRVYKPAFSHEKAIEMILNGECGNFNPILLQCLSSLQDRLAEELKEHNERLEKELVKDSLLENRY